MARLKMPDGVIITAPEGFDTMDPQRQQEAVFATAKAYQAWKSANNPQGASQWPQGASQEPAQAANAPKATPQPQTAQSAPQEQYDGSGASLGNLVNAAYQSTIHGLPAALESGAAVLGRSFAPNAANWNALEQRAADHRSALARNYTHPRGVDPSIVSEIGKGNLTGALQSLGYNIAENAGPTGALIGAASIPYVGLPLAGAIGGTEAADNVSQEKRAAGLKDADRLNGADMTNVAAQSLLNAIPGGGGAIGSSALRRGIANIVDQGAKGTASSLMDQGSVALQGGNVGSVSDVLRNAADAGLTRAGVAGAHAFPGISKEGAEGGVMLAARHLSKYGQGLAEYQKGVAQGKLLSEMSPKARDAVAAYDYNSTIADRADSQIGEGAGSQTANGELGAAKLQLQNIRDYLKANPDANGVTEKPQVIDRVFNEAIREASNHNVRIAPKTDGNAAPSAQQRLASMLPNDVWRPIEARLNTMDLMSQDRLLKRTTQVAGPALRALTSRTLPIAIGGLGVSTGHAGLGALGAGLASALGSVSTKATNTLVDRLGAKIDASFGLGTPPGQRHAATKLALAEQMGISPRNIGDRLKEIEDAARNAAYTSALSSARQRSGGAPNTTQGTQAAPPTQQPQGPVGPGPAPQMQEAPRQVPPAPPRPQGPVGPQAATQAPQAAPQGQAAPQATSQQPYAHTAQEILAQPIPGWAAETSKRYGANPVSIMSFLSNKLADKSLSPEAYTYLTNNDDIGSNIGSVQREINALQHMGQWDSASRFRDAKGAEGVTGRSLDVDLSAGDPERGLRAAKALRTPQSPIDYDGKPIRNQASYEAAIGNEADTAKQIMSARPDLMSAIHAIRAKKTPQKRKEAMEEALSSLPQNKRKEARIFLSPLTAYGYKGAKDTDG